MKRALVCLDHSALSNFVFVQAKDFAERYRAELSLLHVIVPEHGLTLPGATVTEACARSMDDAKRELSELLEQVPEAYRGQVLVDVGEPWRVICSRGGHERRLHPDRLTRISRLGESLRHYRQSRCTEG
jgi:nucleotide-binding universal stress UspA family protein